jgi:hypothetical protein
VRKSALRVASTQGSIHHGLAAELTNSRLANADCVFKSRFPRLAFAQVANALRACVNRPSFYLLTFRNLFYLRINYG